jgi:hypothetical protein
VDALIIVAAGGVGRRLPTLLTHAVTTSLNRIRNSSPPERIRPLLLPRARRYHPTEEPR